MLSNSVAELDILVVDFALFFWPFGSTFFGGRMVTFGGRF